MAIGDFMSQGNLFDEKTAGMPRYIQELLNLVKFVKR